MLTFNTLLAKLADYKFGYFSYRVWYFMQIFSFREDYVQEMSD